MNELTKPIEVITAPIKSTTSEPAMSFLRLNKNFRLSLLLPATLVAAWLGTTTIAFYLKSTQLLIGFDGGYMFNLAQRPNSRGTSRCFQRAWTGSKGWEMCSMRSISDYCRILLLDRSLQVRLPPKSSSMKPSSVSFNNRDRCVWTLVGRVANNLCRGGVGDMSHVSAI